MQVPFNLDVVDSERRLRRVRKILHAQAMVLLLKRESVDDFLIKHIREVDGLLQDYKTIKAQMVSIDEICGENTPPELQAGNRLRFVKLLADGEEQVRETLEMLEDQTCLLGEFKNLDALEVMKDLNEATKIFKRRIRRKMDREKQDKADETEGASVA